MNPKKENPEAIAELPGPIHATGKDLTGHDRRETTPRAAEHRIRQIETQEGIMSGQSRLTTTTMTRPQLPRPSLSNGAFQAVEAERTSASPTSRATKGITTADMTITGTKEADLKWTTGTPLKKAAAAPKTTAAGSAVATTIGIDI
jgi:hypothetical protein